MIANLVSSVGTLLFGMSSLNGGRLSAADCELKVYSGIALELMPGDASSGSNRSEDRFGQLSVFKTQVRVISSLYSASLTNIQLMGAGYSPAALESTVSMSTTLGRRSRKTKNLSDPTTFLKKVTAAAKVAQDPAVLSALLSSATNEATEDELTTLNGVQDAELYASKGSAETETIAVSIPLYPPPPSSAPGVSTSMRF